MAKKAKETQEPEVSKEEVVVAPKTKTDIPEWADKVLSLYPEYDKLYVSHCGGAYTPDTPEFIRGNAELFVNPYFNK